MHGYLHDNDEGRGLLIPIPILTTVDLTRLFEEGRETVWQCQFKE